MAGEDRRPIALFVPRLNGGGAQRVVVRLANEFTSMVDTPIHVVLVRKEGPFVRELVPEVRIVELGAKRTSRAVFSLARYLRSERPIVTVSSLNYANVVCLIAHRLAGRPGRIVVREDNVVLPPSGRWTERFQQSIRTQLMRWLYPSADAVVALSEEVLATMLEAGIRIADTAVTIANPVNVDFGAEGSGPTGLGLTEGTRYVCAVGRLTRQKGFDVLLDAFSRVRDDDLHLVIVGEGERRSELERQVEVLGITDRVHMPGFVDDVAGVMRGS